MGCCTAINRPNKIIQANKMSNAKNDLNLNSTSEKKEEINNKEDKNNASLISEKNSNEKEEKDNYPDIVITYMFNGKSEFELSFKTKDNISNLFDILLEKKSKYAEYDLIVNDKISLSTKLNEKIGSIFPKTEKAEVNMLYLGLDISDDIKSEYENNTEVIGSPLYNLGENFGVLIYFIKDNIFRAEIIKNKKLSKFNHLSSVCNMNNVLFISGGDEQKNNTGKTKPINLFYSIDLLKTNKIEELPSLNTPRCFHSMIYIPKKYIFIVGGGTLDVELYDVKKKEISIDSQMKETRNESTLFVMNNSFLYTFCGISPEGAFLSTVEKCNLRQKERSWSYVNYAMADNTIFGECFYIGHFFSDSSIILFASNEGDNNEYSNILFDIEYEDSPTISYYEGDNKINDVVPEKIFHPVGDGNAIMIPLVGTTAKIYKIDEAIKLNVENFPEALKDIV
jgi:hypothetical protein